MRRCVTFKGALWVCAVLMAVVVPRAQGAESATKVFTKEQVAQHKSNSSCYLIIEGMVYDATRYLKEHASKHDYDLLPWCGRDATKGWLEKDGEGKPHSRKALLQLKPLKVGTLAPEQTSDTSKIEERIAVITGEMQALAKEIGSKASTDAKQATAQLQERLTVLKGQLNTELDKLAQVSADKATTARKSAGEMLKRLGESLSGD